MSRLRDHLTDCIGCGCLSLENCVLSNPDDVFGERQAGSRLMVERVTARPEPQRSQGAQESRAAEECC